MAARRAMVKRRGLPGWSWVLLVVAGAGALWLWGPFVSSDAEADPDADLSSAVPLPPTDSGDGTVPDPGRTTAATGPLAIEVLDTVRVKGRAPKTGYSRDEFGQRWLDVDRNGCDTRNDILAEQLTDVVHSGPCKVMSGILDDPFTGQLIEFERGQGTSDRVQIDHVVALSDAWQKGAQSLTAEQRSWFANDPLNLLAVDGPSNSAKGDSDAASWLPRNKGFRCEYVARQVAVKATYDLWMTQAEHDAIAKVLSSCPGERVPVSELVTPTPNGPQNIASEVYYKNCAAVRAAGAAPLHRGEPGYSLHLDGNADGVACE